MTASHEDASKDYYKYVRISQKSSSLKISSSFCSLFLLILIPFLGSVIVLTFVSKRYIHRHKDRTSVLTLL